MKAHVVVLVVVAAAAAVFPLRSSGQAVIVEDAAAAALRGAEEVEELVDGIAKEGGQQAAEAILTNGSGMLCSFMDCPSLIVFFFTYFAVMLRLNGVVGAAASG